MSSSVFHVEDGPDLYAACSGVGILDTPTNSEL